MGKSRKRLAHLGLQASVSEDTTRAVRLGNELELDLIMV